MGFNKSSYIQLLEMDRDKYKKLSMELQNKIDSLNRQYEPNYLNEAMSNLCRSLSLSLYCPDRVIKVDGVEYWDAGQVREEIKGLETRFLSWEKLPVEGVIKTKDNERGPRR